MISKMKTKKDKVLHKSLKVFKESVEHPENFLSVQKKEAERLKELVKTLYDYGTDFDDVKSSDRLPNLILDDLDEEQIWQQLELKNNSLWSRNVADTSRALALHDEKLQLKYFIEGDENLEEDDDDSDDEELDNERDENGVSDDEVDDDFEEDEAEAIQENEMEMQPHGGKSSIVDDNFFKLHEMKQFLEDEDRKEMRKQKGIIEEDADDERIDMFQEIDTDEDEEDVNENAKYGDFFGREGETVIDEKLSYKEKLTKLRKKMRKEDLGEEESEVDEDEFIDKANLKLDMENEDENGENEDQSEDESEHDENDDKPKSSFEIREQRLKSRIKRMEDDALKGKSWQLRGEVDAQKRPLNSLLEEVLEFDSSVRPAPIITEETTLKLEDIIKQRIKDKAYDDVQRKFKPVETPNEFRKKLILDQEKSKDSLVKVYENEYLKQVEAASSNSTDNHIKQQPKEHREISNLMKSVFSKLDALTNFHYTPKRAAPELKIITNTPAISMEDIQPVSVSDAAILAPEEIRRRDRGDVIGKSERTQTDKNREIRHKKMKQKNIRRIEEQKQKDGIKIGSHKNKDQLLEKVVKSRNVEKMNTNSKQLKSSKAFFDQLQDNVTTKVSKLPKTKKDGENKQKTAVKLKL